jgi:hypothetical protein
MSDPDRGTSFGTSFGAALLITFLLTIQIIGYFEYNVKMGDKYDLRFYGILGLFIIISSYIYVFFANLAIQASSCGKNDYGKAALGALPSIGTSAIALLLSYCNSCRIPIASVLANIKYFKMESKKSNSCCKPDINILELERKHKHVETLSYSFYLLFAMLYGISIGNGISMIC